MIYVRKSYINFVLSNPESYFSLVTTICNPIKCDLVQGGDKGLVVRTTLTTGKHCTMKEQSSEVDHLLKSVLVPSFPPNRSQWKKLEIALKFINKSKAEVVRKKSEDDERKEEDNTCLKAREVEDKKRRSSDLELLREQRRQQTEPPPKKKMKVIGKSDSFLKLLGSVGQIM